jgi:hypothetical protein
MSSPFNMDFSANFEILFNVALVKYCKQTGEDLRNHPLAARINSCDSPESILNIFQEQAQAFEESRRGDARLFKWLIPIVNVLHALSTNAILSDGISLVSPADFLIVRSVCFNSILQVFPHAKAVLSGIGILLSVRISLNISDFFSYWTARQPSM